MNRKKILLAASILCFVTIIFIIFLKPSDIKNNPCTFYVGIENLDYTSIVSLWTINDNELFRYTTNAETFATLSLEAEEINRIQTMSIHLEGEKLMLSAFTLVKNENSSLTYYASDLLELFEFSGVDTVEISDDGRLYIESKTGSITIMISQQLCEEINTFRRG